MLVRCVGPDHIQQDLQAQPVRFFCQGVKVRQSAKQGIHIRIVRDVVPEILHRGREKGRDPDGIKAQIPYMLQPRGDALQVSNSVTIRVGKAAGIDLVDGQAPVPGRVHGKNPEEDEGKA